MKILITGHTNGLGKEFFNYFTNYGHTVIGVSRSNGWDISIKFQEICQLAENSDLFFNNAMYEEYQTKFLINLYDKVKIVTSGSIASDYATTNKDYRYYKKILENTHNQLKKKTSNPMLLLKMGYLENYPDKHPIEYKEIIQGVEYWLNNLRVTMLTFENNPNIYKYIK